MYLFLSHSFIPLSSLDSAFHAFPAWLSWSPQSRGGNRAGWERLTDEGRRLWPVRCFPTPLLHQWTQESLQRTQLLSHYRRPPRAPGEEPEPVEMGEAGTRGEVGQLNSEEVLAQGWARRCGSVLKKQGVSCAQETPDKSTGPGQIHSLNKLWGLGPTPSTDSYVLDHPWECLTFSHPFKGLGDLALSSHSIISHSLIRF